MDAKRPQYVVLSGDGRVLFGPYDTALEAEALVAYADGEWVASTQADAILDLQEMERGMKRNDYWAQDECQTPCPACDNKRGWEVPLTGNMTQGELWETTWVPCDHCAPEEIE